MPIVVVNVWAETLSVVADMKKIGYLTFSAVMSALAAVIMLASYFPYFTYSAPAVAGLLIMVVLFECKTKYAVMSYITSSVLVLLMSEPESAVTFVLFFGFYPIVKVFFEKIHNIILRYAVKITAFNFLVFLMYAVVLKLMGIDGEFASESKLMIYLLLVVANVFFVVYDFALTRLSGFYFYKFHDRVSRLIKNR